MRVYYSSVMTLEDNPTLTRWGHWISDEAYSQRRNLEHDLRCCRMSLEAQEFNVGPLQAWQSKSSRQRHKNNSVQALAFSTMCASTLFDFNFSCSLQSSPSCS
jgi:hypothetical protein